MKFQVGDIVVNQLIQEKGRIVRMVNTKENKVAYVVVVELHPRWGEMVKESLWIDSQVMQAS